MLPTVETGYEEPSSLCPAFTLDTGCLPIERRTRNVGAMPPIPDLRLAPVCEHVSGAATVQTWDPEAAVLQWSGLASSFGHGGV